MLHRILTVDDSAAIRKLVRLQLNGLGAAVDEACNGAEGLKLLARNAYDLIVVDLMMPVMDGVVMLRMKDAMRNQTPVIVLTAEVGDELNQVMSNPCVMDYVRKPLSSTALRVAAMQVLSLSAKT